MSSAEPVGPATLAQRHDCLLVDLDGTVYRGDEPTGGAVQALARVRARTLFVTNNASRRADDVAAHLNRLGFCTVGGDVVTSAQTVAQLLAAQLPGGSRVLVVGTEALAGEIAAVGLRPVRRCGDEPVAVVQGHSPETGWADLAEAALAIRAGALWMATNIDRTLPSERGLLPGNGAMVAALRTATDAAPRIAGKPSPALMEAALARGDFRAPLVIGDRLDTDIAGAAAAGLPSLLVLTGVNSAWDAVTAPPGQRPTYLGRDLRALHDSPDQLAIAPQPQWRVRVRGRAVTVGSGAGTADGDGLSVVRAVADAVWRAEPDGAAGAGPAAVRVEPDDDTAAAALRRWSPPGTSRPGID